MGLSTDKESTGGSGQAARVRPTDAEIVSALTGIATRLKFIYGAGVAVELALKQQNADRDGELADCLSWGVCYGTDELSRSIGALVEKLSDSLPDRY